ncbi:polysaccharide biosynthesis tyrosine autokinase [bacterium]|nr:polysaccharide biosynthesis tyrosine autokinase [bacterium]
MNEQTNWEAKTEERDIRYYFEVLTKYAPLIFIITVITTGLAIAITLNMHKVYQGKVLLCIEPQDNTLIDNVRVSDQRAYALRQTQIQMFYSRNLIKMTLDTLRTNSLLSFTIPNRKATEAQLITAFSKKISLKSEMRTDLVWLFVEDEDKRRASAYCNTLAETYIRFSVQRRMAVMQLYYKQMNENANAKKAELITEEQALLEYKSTNNYQNVPGHIELLNSEIAELQHMLQNNLVRLDESGLSETDKFTINDENAKINREILHKRSTIIALDEIVKNVKVREMQLESTRSQYRDLLALVSKFALGSNMENYNVRIVDYSEVPTSPIKPNAINNLIMGFVIGLVLGLGLTFFLEYWDDTLKTPDDVERFLHMPVLGTVPKMAKSNNVQDLERIVEFYPKSIITESYQSIRTNILFSSPKPIKVMVITSSAMSEGKTTTAANIAEVMAAAGDKVLLIDADMRRPRVHKIFGEDNDGGLSAYLVGMKNVDELTRKTTMPNLNIINSGHTPPVPVELLNSPRLGELVKWARDNYDRVIIDAPPYMVVTDSAIIAQHTDAALLVANGDRTPREQVKNCLAQLKKINVNVLGIILNNVDISRGGYYRYGYTYSYYRSYRAYRSSYRSAYRSAYKSSEGSGKSSSKEPKTAAANPADNRRKALEAYEKLLKEKEQSKEKKDKKDGEAQS